MNILEDDVINLCKNKICIKLHSDSLDQKKNAEFYILTILFSLNKLEELIL